MNDQRPLAPPRVWLGRIVRLWLVLLPLVAYSAYEWRDSYREANALQRMGEDWVQRSREQPYNGIFDPLKEAHEVFAARDTALERISVWRAIAIGGATWPLGILCLFFAFRWVQGPQAP